MDIGLINRLKNKQYWWTNIVFYFSLALLTASVFSYGAFALKTYFQNQDIDELEKKIASYPTDQQRIYEKEVLDYKKKIDIFTELVNKHRISSNVFAFIESKTLPKVWFSNFNLLKNKDEISLSGKSDSMEILSYQFEVFEESKDYVKDVSVLNIRELKKGDIDFILKLSLDPKLFDYSTNL